MSTQAGAGRRRTPLISRVVFAALVLATVLAFFIAQHLKVTTPFISGVTGPAPAAINPVTGPTSCRSATLSFYILHHVDDVDVFVLDQSGATVRTLASGVPMRKPQAPTAQGFAAVTKSFTWTGRDNAGRLVVPGTYFFFVHLVHQDHTIPIPQAVRVTRGAACAVKG